MKFFHTLPILALTLTIASCEQRKLLFLDPINLVKDTWSAYQHISALDQRERARKAKLGQKHKNPMVRSPLVDYFTDLGLWFEEPSWDRWTAISLDMMSYWLMPMEGGFTRPEAHRQYVKDVRGYEAAGVDEDYLFKQTSNMFKEEVWGMFGQLARMSVE